MKLENQKPTLYELLQVKADADVKEIRLSYRSLIAKIDFENSSLSTNKVFKELTDAWKVLCDQQTRAAYDKTISMQNESD